MGIPIPNGDCSIAGRCNATAVYEYDPKVDIWRPVAFEADSRKALSAPVAVYLATSDEIVAFDTKAASRTLSSVVKSPLLRLQLPRKGPTELLSNPSCEEYDQTASVPDIPGLVPRLSKAEVFALPPCSPDQPGCWSIKLGAMRCTRPIVGGNSHSGRSIAPSGEYVFDLHAEVGSNGKACQWFPVNSAVGLSNPGLTLQVTGFVAADANASFEERFRVRSAALGASHLAHRGFCVQM